MAGDWIKMRVGLVAHPRTMRVAECLLETAGYLDWSCLSYGVQGYPPPGKEELRKERHAALRVTRYVTVTALLKFWGYANEHAKGDHITALWPEDVDEITGVPGFAEAIEAAGWAEFDRLNGGMTMPNFEEHNTSATERTSAAAERQKRYRDRQKAARAEAESSDVTRDVTVTPREEKRREEKKKDSEPSGFAEFWQEYPNHSAKATALKAWLKVPAELHPTIMAAVVVQKRSAAWTKDNGQFVPHAATWLNNKRWEDQMPANSGSTNLFAGAL